jgi:hypothetical protein
MHRALPKHLWGIAQSSLQERHQVRSVLVDATPSLTTWRHLPSTPTYPCADPSSDSRPERLF